MGHGSGFGTGQFNKMEYKSGMVTFEWIDDLGTVLHILLLHVF